MSMPDVSVVLPVYNGAKYVSEAIKSILSQTLTNIELIIVDDGSTDDSLTIIRSFDDERIRIIKQPNSGISQALNHGISLARSNFIARMDADDIALLDRLERQLAFLKSHPNTVAIGCSATVIDQNGEDVCVISRPGEDSELRKRIPSTPFIHPTVMFRKDVFYIAGQYPLFMRHGAEDAVLFWRMAKYGKISNLSEPLLKYRIHPGSVSRKPKEFFSKLEEIADKAIVGKKIPASDFEALDQKASLLSDSSRMALYHLTLAKFFVMAGEKRKSVRHLCRACLNSVCYPDVLLVSMAWCSPFWFIQRLSLAEEISRTNKESGQSFYLSA
ncbi:MAG: glycosyltransferase [Methanobacteriota archaeon]|nr:MAG: glycosyltransferase [Euryarchaeota archaeon]